MAESKKEERQRKHVWVADAICQQEILSNLLGYTEAHVVPESRLDEKLTHYYTLIGSTAKPAKSWGAVGKRIREENPRRTQFYLKPIFISVIDLEYKNSGNALVFRILSEKSGKTLYVDELRTYSNWKDYLSNNTLPKLHIIYPVDGNYLPKTEFVLEESEACSPIKLARKLTKIAATATALTSTVALAAVPFFPVLAPAALGLYLTAAGSGAIMGVDGVVTLVDLAEHNESLNVTNPRAFDAYLDIGSACGGLVRGGAATAVKFLKDDAVTATRILRVVKIAGSTVQNVSLLVKCLNPILGELSMQDLKAFCMSFLNLDLKTSVEWSKSLIQLFIWGIAIYKGDPTTIFRTLYTVKDVAEFVLVCALPKVMPFCQPYLEELASYFGDLLCNRVRCHLPAVVDVDKFDKLSGDFFSLIEKLNLFFQTDLLAMKFNGFQFFSTYSISALTTVWSLMRNHRYCKGGSHSLTQPELVQIWFKFMDLIRCRSPQHLVNGTRALLDKLDDPKTKMLSMDSGLATLMLKEWADEFTFNSDPETQYNVDKPAIELGGMAVHVFYSPQVGDKTKLTRELKQDYREKVEAILRKKVTKENSKFDKNGNGRNALLHLSPEHKCREIVFNRTVLRDGCVMLFVTTLDKSTGDLSPLEKMRQSNLFH